MTPDDLEQQLDTLDAWLRTRLGTGLAPWQRDLIRDTRKRNHPDTLTTSESATPRTHIQPVDNHRKRNRKRNHGAKKAQPPGCTPPYVHPPVKNACGNPWSTRWGK